MSVNGRSRSILHVLRHYLLAIGVLSTFIAGYWMLDQTLNSVINLRRDYVHLPFYEGTINVWLYHDIAYTFLWVSYIISVIKEVKNGEIKLSKDLIIIAIIGFALLTAGLWLIQDAMVAVLSYDRLYVDLPFFALKTDLYNLRAGANILIFLGFLIFYTLGRK
jgi:hypothetical protein